MRRRLYEKKYTYTLNEDYVTEALETAGIRVVRVSKAWDGESGPNEFYVSIKSPVQISFYLNLIDVSDPYIELEEGISVYADTKKYIEFLRCLFGARFVLI